MILSFKNKKTEKVFHGQPVKSLSGDIARRAQRKMTILHAAVSLDDLRSPPGNKLEQLSGDRKGQYSIRVNDQFRICFHWDGSASNVELVDYH